MNKNIGCQERFTEKHELPLSASIFIAIDSNVRLMERGNTEDI